MADFREVSIALLQVLVEVNREREEVIAQNSALRDVVEQASMEARRLEGAYVRHMDRSKHLLMGSINNINKMPFFSNSQSQRRSQRAATVHPVMLSVGTI